MAPVAHADPEGHSAQSDAAARLVLSPYRPDSHSSAADAPGLHHAPRSITRCLWLVMVCRLDQLKRIFPDYYPFLESMVNTVMISLGSYMRN